MSEAQQIALALAGVYDGLPQRLLEVPFDWSRDRVTITGRFFWLPIRNYVFTVEELAEYVYHRVAPFCLPRAERETARRKYLDTNDDRWMMEIQDKAKGLFIRSPRQVTTLGEPGELLLFTILEGIEKFPQLACKMYLKTNNEMPVHGTDGIHVILPTDRPGITIVWGESKVYGTISNALDAICASLCEFLGIGGGVPLRDRDVKIIRDHMNVPPGPARDALIDAMNPYTEAYNHTNEEFACFVAFTFAGCVCDRAHTPAEVQRRFLEAYAERIRTACDLFAEKVQEAGLSHLAIRLYLLPMPDVNLFRRAFMRRLGVELAE